LIKTAPIALAALGGVLCERSGVVNVALEGQLAAGAFTAVVVAAATGNPLLGLAAGIAAGALLGYALGLAATRFAADQIVAGIGLNVFALGACAFGLVLVFGREGTSDEVRALGDRGEAVLILAGFGLRRLCIRCCMHRRRACGCVRAAKIPLRFATPDSIRGAYAGYRARRAARSRGSAASSWRWANSISTPTG
jgi:hypothetical protein